MSAATNPDRYWVCESCRWENAAGSEVCERCAADRVFAPLQDLDTLAALPWHCDVCGNWNGRAVEECTRCGRDAPATGSLDAEILPPGAGLPVMLAACCVCLLVFPLGLAWYFHADGDRPPPDGSFMVALWTVIFALVASLIACLIWTPLRVRRTHRGMRQRAAQYDAKDGA